MGFFVAMLLLIVTLMYYSEQQCKDINYFKGRIAFAFYLAACSIATVLLVINDSIFYELHLIEVKFWIDNVVIVLVALHLSYIAYRCDHLSFLKKILRS